MADWTEREDAQVISMWKPGIDLEALIRQLGRTKKSILRRAGMLGLCSIKDLQNGKRGEKRVFPAELREEFREFVVDVYEDYLEMRLEERRKKVS